MLLAVPVNLAENEVATAKKGVQQQTRIRPQLTPEKRYFCRCAKMPNCKHGAKQDFLSSNKGVNCLVRCLKVQLWLPPPMMAKHGSVLSKVSRRLQKKIAQRLNNCAEQLPDRAAILFQHQIYRRRMKSSHLQQLPSTVMERGLWQGAKRKRTS